MPTDLDYWNTDDGPYDGPTGDYDAETETFNYYAALGVAFDSPEDYS